MKKGFCLIIVIVTVVIVCGGGWWIYRHYGSIFGWSGRLIVSDQKSSQPTTKDIAPDDNSVDRSSDDNSQKETCHNDYYQTTTRRVISGVSAFDFGYHYLTRLDDVSEKQFEKDYLADPVKALQQLTGLDCLEYLYINYAITSYTAPAKWVLIDSIKQIPDLPNLKILILSNQTKLTNLDGVQRFTLLQVLDLQQAPIKDIKPLAELVDIQYLNLDRTFVSDLGPLAKMVKMKSLNINREYIRVSNNLESSHDHPITDFGPLSKMTDLRELYAEYFLGSDLSPLSNMTKLETLRLANVLKVSDFSVVSQLSSLSDFTISGYGFTEADCQRWSENIKKTFCLPY